MIAQSTTIQAYQLRAGGTRARMAILRMIAAASQDPRVPPSLRVADWRAARRYTLANYTSAYATFSQGAQCWYAHDGEQFRDERFADECDGGPSHRGWLTNADGHTFRDGSGLCRGIVARLPHGRFIAGYWWGDNGERVYFPGVFTDESDAAAAADSHAERFADTARDDSERFNAMQDAEENERTISSRAELAIQARNVSARHRNIARDAIAELREARDALQTATREYEEA